MPPKAAEPQGVRRPVAPLPASTKPAQEQIAPPLMVEGLEAIRDTHC